jgi:hypothetical protein
MSRKSNETVPLFTQHKESHVVTIKELLWLREALYNKLSYLVNPDDYKSLEIVIYNLVYFIYVSWPEYIGAAPPSKASMGSILYLTSILQRIYKNLCTSRAEGQYYDIATVSQYLLGALMLAKKTYEEPAPNNECFQILVFWNFDESGWKNLFYIPFSEERYTSEKKFFDSQGEDKKETGDSHLTSEQAKEISKDLFHLARIEFNTFFAAGTKVGFSVEETLAFLKDKFDVGIIKAFKTALNQFHLQLKVLPSEELTDLDQRLDELIIEHNQQAGLDSSAMWPYLCLSWDTSEKQTDSAEINPDETNSKPLSPKGQS